VAADSPLVSSSGGFWGPGVFCVNTNGDLLSLDSSGVATQRGSGFGVPWGMAFGRDGANLQFTEPSTTGNKFYRLPKP